MKKFFNFLLAPFIVLILLSAILLTGLMMFCFSSSKYTVPIMMYHHVNNREFEAEDITPENFRKQMNFLKKYRYNVISLDELVNAVRFGRSLPRNSVAIAFDDGNEDNYTEAFPILKEFGFPATFFISPAFTTQKGFMNWGQLRELKDAGFSFGSHGMTQAYLPSQPPEILKYELFESKRILEKELGVKIDLLAYPVGGFNDQVKALAQQAGYKAAVTTNRGYDRFDKDLFEINRIRFNNKDNRDIILMVKLSGYYNRFRDLKKPY